MDIFSSDVNIPPNGIIEKINLPTKEFSASDFYNDDFTLLAMKRN